ANRSYHLAGQGNGPAPAHHTHPVACLHAEVGCQVGVEFQQRLGILLYQGADAACLRTAWILRDDPTGGEQHRKVGVDVFSRRAVLHRMEARPAVGMIKPAILEESWHTRMGVIRARPEDALLALNFLVGDAVIVTQPAPRHPPEFTEDVLDTGIGELLPGGKTPRQVADDLPVRTRLSRWLHGLADANDAAFG